MTTQNILKAREDECHEIRDHVAQVNGAAKRDGLQTHAEAVQLELCA